LIDKVALKLNVQIADALNELLPVIGSW